mmetsp:Transcript_36186/g.144628  ORF Transcript_36186/g.144628 Transcript_36186/m.144628 type:complete len:126 (+) Transcript_36186:254-631(+)
MEKRMLSDPRNEDNPRVAFLFKKDDKPYLLYRKLVGPLDEGDEEPEEPNKVSSSTVTKAEVATPLNSAREVPVDVPSATVGSQREIEISTLNNSSTTGLNMCTVSLRPIAREGSPRTEKRISQTT